jgi:putative hydrolase of the HAD superfamily
VTPDTRACAQIGYPNPNHVIDSYNPPAAVAFDDVAPALTRLRAASVKVIAVSNCAPWDTDGMNATGLTPLLDEVFYSFQIGAAKPDPRIFHHIQAAIRAEPAQILHIGDALTADVQGPTSAGWSALLLKREAGGAEAHQNHQVRTIRSLADLVIGE